MQRYTVTITGKVQGVLFRDTARQVANRLSLTGFARNEPNGSVYIEVEGNETALQAFLEWCWQGSAHSQVASVEYTQHPTAGYTDFVIR